ncbi:putative tRNA adenosine deaminase-associated protein [Friedmanniella luteola]|uniref:Putative tRNA adenosine deaminase-associated protein n=1 Tax=Friedmanniella luteola TaxID=546871 RepID=A0A1H1L750_9ACTN|nr:tRNA adenosine deaminase-associated protein [Friedmanniella luteola]SDR70421.1 putative tRNA adenosine deaminase-associated protein [Friedmanniella luteola]
MSDFDDDEYESFDLDGPAPDSRPGTAPAATTAAPDVDDDDDEDDDDDDLEDAADDEIDFVISAYREEGQLVVQAMDNDLANDLEELIAQLRRLPGDAGALGFVSLVEEVFVVARVRGQHVQVLLSDGASAGDWPIAHDVADFLDEDIPDPDEDDSEPMGDLGIVADLGMSDFDMAALIEDLDLGSDQMLVEIAEKIKLNPQFRKVAEAAAHS